jgi:tetratricopeptide (TPR) repeat protein
VDFTTAVSELIEKHVRTPEVRSALNAGKIEEAASRATGEEEITVLLKSTNPADWDRAVELLLQMPAPNPQYFVTFSYLFWEARNFPRAKEVAEEGLKIAEARNSPVYIGKLKNTLAYVYSELGECEAKARDFASSALAADSDSPTRLDTMCFVMMKFAQSEREIAEALTVNEKARAKGLPIEDYMGNVALAGQMLQNVKDAESAPAKEAELKA